jgi:hypothetical protein
MSSAQEWCFPASECRGATGTGQPGIYSQCRTPFLVDYYASRRLSHTWNEVVFVRTEDTGAAHSSLHILIDRESISIDRTPRPHASNVPASRTRAREVCFYGETRPEEAVLSARPCAFRAAMGFVGPRLHSRAFQHSLTPSTSQYARIEPH